MQEPKIPKFCSISSLCRAQYDQPLQKLHKKLEHANRYIYNTNKDIDFCFSYLKEHEYASYFITNTSSSDNLDKFNSKKIEEIHKEIDNYISTLSYGIEKLKKEKFLSLKLICSLHKMLVSNVRGSQYPPGTFRTSQNWIGGIDHNINYTPPSPKDVAYLMKELDSHIHNTCAQPLIHISFIYLHFLSIHPFTDGNGRLARMLISLLFQGQSLVIIPFISIHLFIKKNRRQYELYMNQARYDKNKTVNWVLFFFQAIEYTINDFMEYCKKRDIEASCNLQLKIKGKTCK